MSFAEIFIVIIIVVILIMYIHNYVSTEVEYVRSKVDGRAYLVLSLPDKQKAADYIADINKSLIKLIKHLRAKFPDNKDYERLYKNYDAHALSEGSPQSSYTSFTTNKSAITACIRHPDSSFVDKNTIMYVLIHELGHMSTSEIGHTKHFWDLFKEMLGEAVEIGIYAKKDYKANPAPYCGIQLSSSVLA